MSTSSLIIQSYLSTENTNTKDKSRYEQEVAHLLKYNKDNKGGDFLTPLNFYLGILENTDSVLFPYLTDKQKNHVLRDLQVTYLLLLVEKKYELEHQKTENVATYEAQLKKCQQLIDKINYKKACDAQHVIPAPEREYASDGKTVAYLGIYFGQALATQMVNVANRQTKTIKETMGWVNEKRLYWVWASSLLKTTIDLLPDDFFNSGTAKHDIRTPDPYTGTMSWALYYFRFSLNLSLLLKHTIAGPWMSEEEKSIPWTERFLTQWDQRKFTLLNDSVWATGNLVCFFWLCGKGAAGTWGDVLTIALLVFDIALAVWDYEEQKTLQAKAVLDYKTAIEKLDAEINALTEKEIERKKKIEQLQVLADDDEAERKRKTTLIKALSDENENDRKKKIELAIQQSALERALSQCEREWRYQKVSLTTNIAYAVGLMVAFALMTAPFLPVAAATAMALTVVGAVLCFAFSVVNNAMKGGLEITKTKETIKDLKQELDDKIKLFESKIDRFKQLLTSPSISEDEKKLLFMEIKKLTIEIESVHAEKAYQEQMYTYNTAKLVRSIVIESLVPPLVFLSMVFLPIGPALGILAAAIALAMTTHVLLNAVFKPEKKASQELEETEEQIAMRIEEDYTSFQAGPDAWVKSNKSLTFFQPPAEEASHTKSLEQQQPKPEDDESTPLLTSQ